MNESLPLALLREIDRICLVFEAAWKTGKKPSIDSLLHQVSEPARPELLVSLLGIDLEYRHRREESPDMDSYARRFPEHRALIEAFFHTHLPAILAQVSARGLLRDCPPPDTLGSGED
jgi:hypothetical protein